MSTGDYIAFPPGLEAHQLINSSNTPLRYLCLSTNDGPEIVIYPDSDKLGALNIDPPIRVVFKRSDAGSSAADYWEGEAESS